jgi:hypothetical protein
MIKTHLVVPRRTSPENGTVSSNAAIHVTAAMFADEAVTSVICKTDTEKKIHSVPNVRFQWQGSGKNRENQA